MKKPETTSLYEFFQRFPNEESARLYFEKKRWNGTIHCGHCSSLDVTECKDHIPMAYRCRECRQHFSVRIGTVLAESRLPLNKWLMAIYMLTTARKGIPSIEVARELEVTQKTARFLCQRIRETWMGSNGGKDNTVQVDETFVGGKEKNKHANKKLRQGRGAVDKAIVIGSLNEKGLITAEMIASTDGVTLQGFVAKNAMAGATVIIDSFPAYRRMNGYNHKVVNHSLGEYVKDQAHTNGIESFWALLKRGYYGIYHHMSLKHLRRYVNEFSLLIRLKYNFKFLVGFSAARCPHTPLDRLILREGFQALTNF